MKLHRSVPLFTTLALTLACGGSGASTARTIPPGSPAWACNGCNLFDVDVDGDVAFVADSSGDMIVLDVTDPATPKEISRIKGKSPNAIKVVGNTVYVADYGQGLWVIDVSDLAHPKELAVVDTPSSDFYVNTDANGLLYVGGAVYDVSNPASPVKKGVLGIDGSSLGVFLDGTTLYAAGGTSGLQIVDVADPAAPKLLSTTATDYAKDVVVIGGKAFVAENNLQKLLTFDVSNLAAPVKLGEVELGDAGTGLALAGDKVAVAAGRKGVLVFDVSDAAAPKQVKDSGDTRHETYRIDAEGGRVWGADKSKGLFNVEL